MTARTDAQALHERRPATVLEADLDYCGNTYGVSPCTAGRKDSGTAQAGSASTITLRAAASGVDDFYNNMTVRITGGTGSGQERKITDYVGSTKVATVSPNWTTNPDATSTYDVIDRPNGCYQVFAGESPCQDQANYVKTVKTIKFCTRGMPIPPGEQIRPYLLKSSAMPVEISTAKGLAMRSQSSYQLVDEPGRDDLDKYIDDRLTPAGGTFWTRLIARNPNAAGRFARARRGYAVTPWDWNTFQTELFIIGSIRGPGRDDTVRVELVDAIRLLDKVKIPVPTDGKLIVDLPGISAAGFAAGGTATTITLNTEASAVDDFYNGQEVLITANNGSGQRRVISDYAGPTRTATVSAWDVIPNPTSVYEVSPLELSMGAGQAAQYPTPGAEPEFIRLGDEVIRYTAKSGDKLTWPDSTYREQFGTARADHKIKDAVVLCRAWNLKAAKTVIEDICNEGGLADTYIDLAGLAVEDTDWLGAAVITVCIAEPETASVLLADLLKDLNMMSWWDAVAQKAKFKCDMPSLAGAIATYTDDTFILEKTEAETLDAERITRAAVDYALLSATADRQKRTNYRTIEVFVDGVAEGPNSYNDKRQDLRQSRWLQLGVNEIVAKMNATRKTLRLGKAPRLFRFLLDPRNEPTLGSLVDLKTRKHTDAAGNPKTVRCRVTKVTDHGGHFQAEARTTGFDTKRYAFICPNGYPNYPSATDDQRRRAFISSGALMSDGTSAYLIC